MPTLERRVSALEQASPATAEITIIRRIVSPGQLDAEIHGLRDGDGKMWTRLPGETEQELINRASREVAREPSGFSRLIGETDA